MGNAQRRYFDLLDQKFDFAAPSYPSSHESSSDNGEDVVRKKPRMNFNENNIIREIKQKLNSYQDRGDEIIFFINSLVCFSLGVIEYSCRQIRHL